MAVVFQDELRSGECKGEGLSLEEPEEEWVLEVCVISVDFCFNLRILLYLFLCHLGSVLSLGDPCFHVSLSWKGPILLSSFFNNC